MKRIFSSEADKIAFSKGVAQIFVGLVESLIILLTWNWLMPDLFKVKEIGFGQAIAIMILSHVLFRGL